MIVYRNLILIGTSHISPDSILEVKKIIAEKKPAFVAVELDKGRLQGIFQKKNERKRISFKELKKLGFSSFIFVLFGAWIEEKLGKMVGTKPGSEMKAAVIEAAKIQAKVVLIDQEISVTLKRLFKTLTWKEKFRFVGDLVKGLLGFGEKISFDLRKVPKEELMDKLIGQVQERYPSFYKVLIEERNEIMGKRILQHLGRYKEETLIAVVGAGHIKGIISYLEKNS